MISDNAMQLIVHIWFIDSMYFQQMIQQISLMCVIAIDSYARDDGSSVGGDFARSRIGSDSQFCYYRQAIDLRKFTSILNKL